MAAKVQYLLYFGIFGIITQTEGATLYSFNSSVVQLHATNFTQNVANSEMAWMVEFYATWCGHCQRFASYWLGLAEDVKGQFNIKGINKVY